MKRQVFLHIHHFNTELCIVTVTECEVFHSSSILGFPLPGVRSCDFFLSFVCSCWGLFIA